MKKAFGAFTAVIVLVALIFGIAACSSKTYTVTFEVNGGEAIEAQRTSGGSITLPEPERQEYDFLGWYDNADFDGEPVQSPYKPTSDITLYARWEHSVDITDGAITSGAFAYNPIWQDGALSGYAVSIHEMPEDGILNIPSSFEGVPVKEIAASGFKETACVQVNVADGVSIGARAFENCTALKSVKIGSSAVGLNAFSGCTALTSLELGDVSAIGNYAFRSCTALERVVWNASSCASAGTAAAPIFDGCVSLSQVTFGAAVTSIPAHAFSGCASITEISLPNVTSIGASAFLSCENISELSLPKVETIGASAFSGCSSILNLSLPKATTIGASAFRGLTKAASVDMPCAATIGDSAFMDCDALNSLTIPESATTIGGNAFRNCDNIESIAWNAIDCTVSETVSSAIFYGCTSLTQVTFGEVRKVPAFAFYGCVALTEVSLPTSVKTIGRSAFASCVSIVRVSMSGVNAIEESAFYNCSSIVSIVIPRTVTTIGNSAFRNCSSLSALTISEGVTTIGEYAFGGCGSLTSLTVPRTVTKIEDFAFQYCIKLVEICNESSLVLQKGNVDNGHVAYYARNVYSSISGESKLTTENGYVFCHDNGTDYLMGYSGSETALVLPERNGGYIVYDYAFSNNTEITSVTIAQTVTEIGGYAFNNCSSIVSVVWNATDCAKAGSSTLPIFYNCTKLRSVTFGNGVKIVPNFAFYNLSALENVVLSDTVTTIGEGAFSGCRALKNAQLPAELTTIGANAFYFCSSLIAVRMSEKLTSIGNNAFTGCFKLVEINNRSQLTVEAGSNSYGGIALYAKNIYGAQSGESKISVEDGYIFFQDDVVYLMGCSIGMTELILPTRAGGYEIYDYAFCNDGALISVTLSESVTAIGDSAFLECRNLVSVTMSSSVVTIGEAAFRRCYALESLKLNSGLVSIGSNAFDFCQLVEEIAIPATVTSIGGFAFANCRALTVIWCETTAKPNGWSADWNKTCGATIRWGSEWEYSDDKPNLL